MPNLERQESSRERAGHRFRFMPCLFALLAVLGLLYLALRGLGAFLITGDVWNLEMPCGLGGCTNNA